jgi:hypothetical protein
MATVTTRRRRPVVVGVAVLTAVCLARVEAQRVAEYQVKAAFLQNFARFVEWPPAPAGGEFHLCVLGDDPFGHWIDEATAGGRVKDRPVVVRRIRRIDEAATCQTLFISPSESTRMRALLDGLGTAPVLTVSDLPQFADRGGMIGFTTVDGRVRFVANPAVARSAGLQLTSELLRVAASVVGRSSAKE